MNGSHAQGELLAQVRPAVTTAVTLYTPSGIRVEVTRIVVCLLSGGTGSPVVELFHDDDGTTFDNTTIIYNDVLNSGTSRPTVQVIQAQHPGSGIFIKPGGALGCRTGTANDVTFSVYGISAQIAQRVKGEM